MSVDPALVQRIAKETGFREYVVEQILHLKSMLKMINDDPLLRGRLILIGGTAINLFDKDMPRLSVDIDLDYSHRGRGRFTYDLIDKHLSTFIRIADTLDMRCFENRHLRPKQSDLLRLMFEYDSNFLSQKGTVKIDVSYLMKDTIFNPIRRKMKQLHPTDGFGGLSFLVAAPCELWAGKAVALVYKSVQDPKPSEVADLYSMQMARHLFDVSRFQQLLIDGKRTINGKQLRTAFILKGIPRIRELFLLTGDGIRNCPERDIKIELDPYLRQDENGQINRPPLAQMKTLAKEFLHNVCSNSWNKAEKEFVEDFQEKGHFKPDLLFKKHTTEYKRLSQNEYLKLNLTPFQK